MVGNFGDEAGRACRLEEVHAREMGATNSASGKRVDAFLSHSESSAEQLSAKLNDILLAQDYQDLTVQVIKRVVNLVGRSRKTSSSW